MNKRAILLLWSKLQSQMPSESRFRTKTRFEVPSCSRLICFRVSLLQVFLSTTALLPIPLLRVICDSAEISASSKTPTLTLSAFSDSTSVSYPSSCRLTMSTTLQEHLSSTVKSFLWQVPPVQLPKHSWASFSYPGVPHDAPHTGNSLSRCCLEEKQWVDDFPLAQL